MRGVIALLVVACTVVATGCGGSRAGRALPGLTGDRLARLNAIITDQLQELAVDPHPSSLMVFATQLHEALVAIAEGRAGFEPRPPGSHRVYLVVARGHFISNGPSNPQQPCAT